MYHFASFPACMKFGLYNTCLFSSVIIKRKLINKNLSLEKVSLLNNNVKNVMERSIVTKKSK